eukprot:TRINITY_DN9192_c0_g1_i1.p1 TRINITY_DN9192_c0_g1~~TRINITY_DN9192_c0_g1_i1.p1  ORF type:complete len:115 (-),score=11.43 TRINITY_DN9192_c0_g1_i1:121-465(-)
MDAPTSDCRKFDDGELSLEQGFAPSINLSSLYEKLCTLMSLRLETGGDLEQHFEKLGNAIREIRGTNEEMLPYTLEKATYIGSIRSDLLVIYMGGPHFRSKKPPSPKSRWIFEG